MHTVCLYNKLTDTPPPRARPGPSRPSLVSGGPPAAARCGGVTNPTAEHRDAVGRYEVQLGVLIAHPGLSPGPINWRPLTVTSCSSHLGIGCSCALSLAVDPAAESQGSPQFPAPPTGRARSQPPSWRIWPEKSRLQGVPKRLLCSRFRARALRAREPSRVCRALCAARACCIVL